MSFHIEETTVMVTLKEIQDLYQSDKCFALCKLPNDGGSFFVQSPICRRLANTDDVDSCRGFVLYPFDNESQNPVVIEGDAEEVVLPSKVALSRKKHNFATQMFVSDTYKREFDTFINAIANGEFEKLVLSRSETHKILRLDMIELFTQLVSAFDNAFVYIARIEDGELWVGVTPEIFVRKKNMVWQTVALAGTLPHDSCRKLTGWSAKNRYEQEIVFRYITDKLSAKGIATKYDETHIIQAGDIDHLRTNIFFESDNIRLCQIIKLLHPTPAVCGTPQDKAMRFIRDNETDDRGFYSGIVGLVGSMVDLFVNLRCAKIVGDSATFYAGGGIVKDSDLESEWRETTLKMDTLKQFF